MKIKLYFYFHTSFWWVKRFYEGLKGFHKTFLDTTKKCDNKNFFASFEIGRGKVKGLYSLAISPEKLHHRSLLR